MDLIAQIERPSSSNDDSTSMRPTTNRDISDTSMASNAHKHKETSRMTNAAGLPSKIATKTKTTISCNGNFPTKRQKKDILALLLPSQVTSVVYTAVQADSVNMTAAMKRPRRWCWWWIVSSIVLAGPFVAAMDSTMTTTTTTKEECSNSSSKCSIPSTFDAPFGSYPNLLGVSSEEDRRTIFHPVIVYPKHIISRNGDDLALPVGDHRTARGMASLEQVQRAKRRSLWRKTRRWVTKQSTAAVLRVVPLKRLRWFFLRNDHDYDYAIGKYDENRVSMYTNSDLFDNVTNTIDGYGGRRTVHLGIDLSAPVGTPVHAICDGVVHSVGYNPDHGDYGYVIVIEHSWESITTSTNRNGATTTIPTPTTKRVVWALYGHLDASTVKRTASNQPGLPIQKGQVIGRLGDIYENGGWTAPHVHFQLSMKPPDQPHDMPGASSVEDRPTALLQYPDPRYVLGPLY